MERTSQRRPFVSRRSLIRGASGAAAAGLLAGPALASPGTGFRHAALFQEEQPVDGGTLTFGVGKPPVNSFHPLNTISSVQNYVIDALFLRLVYGKEWGPGVNPEDAGPIELGVAETMTEIEADRVWEFKIRDNVKWHDGTPVTADDVIFGIWLSLNKDAGAVSETPPASIKGGDELRQNGGGSLTPPYDLTFEGAQKIDDMTVRIELTHPIPNYWVNWSVGYWPMPYHIFGQMPLENLFDEPYVTTPMGNGPFKATKFVADQYIELTANDDFYLGRPHIDTLIIRFGDPDTLTAALEAGEIDGAEVTAGPVYDRLTGLPDLVGNAVPTTLPIGFAMNYQRFPDEAGAINRAISHAIDVPSLNSELYSGTLNPSNYLFEHVVGLETPPEGFPTYDYDPEKAKEILAGINWDSSRELEWILWSPPSSAQDAMLAMLSDVGLKVKYRVIDVATVIEQLYQEADFDLVLADFGADQDMTANWMYIKCDWIYDNGGYNYARYCNPEVDELWAQGVASTDAAEIRTLFDQVSMIFADQPPQATLWRAARAYVWNRRVRGVFPYQFRLPVRSALERVWLASE